MKRKTSVVHGQKYLFVRGDGGGEVAGGTCRIVHGDRGVVRIFVVEASHLIVSTA